MAASKLLRFIGLTFLGTWIPWMALAARHVNVFAMPWFLIYGLGALFPSAVGLYLTNKDGGRSDLRALLAGTIQVGYRPGWYAVLFLLIPGINVCAALLGPLNEGEPANFQPVLNYLTHPVSLLMPVLTTLLIGPLNEEFGWCGYAYRPCVERLGQAWGNLLLGGLRVAWHLPMFIMLGTDQAKRPFIPFALGIFGLGCLCSWLYAGTGRKISAPILAHFMFNLSIGSLLPLDNAAYWLRGWLYLTVVAVLVASWTAGMRQVKKLGDSVTVIR